MKIQCSTCDARYAISDDKIRGKNVAVRCKRCGETMAIRAEGEAWYVAAGGETQGPLALAALRACLAEGSIDGDAFVWREGMDDWRPARELDAFADLFDDEGEDDAYDDAAPSSAERPLFGVAEPSLTGERSESSVLFSLSNLKDLSRGATATAAAPSPTTTEGSGLIDIRALAQTLGNAPQSAAAPAADELLSFGSPLASPLGAPVMLPERRRSTSLTPILIGGGVAVVAALAAAAVVLVVQLRPTPAPAEPPSAMVDEPAPEAPLPTVGTSSPTPTTNAPSAVAPTDEDAPEPTAAVVETPEATTPTTRARPRHPNRPEPVATAERPTPTVTTRPVTRPAPADDDPLGRIFDERPTAPAPAPTRALPPTPSRGDVVSAMRALEGPVRACGAGSHGMAEVRFRFASNGTVQSANVGGDLPAPVRSCVAQAARSARVSEFGRDSFSVAYPFRL
ncbi:MAG: zinc-ribbon domain-containing protein [Sandaracinaceae bacterium]|nr:zinc-ribbon domain-containing protein [Sandaracinaceae bacterium]